MNTHGRAPSRNRWTRVVARAPRLTATLAGVVVLAVASATRVPAQEKQPPPAAGTPKDFTIPAPRRFTLSNGVMVTLVPFGQVPKATIRIVVGAANVHEKRDEVWLADLTGSMMREGTSTLTADAVAREFATMGGELSINVGPDRTSIGADVLSERAPGAVALLADVVQRPRLPETELARVKGNLLRNLAIQRSTPQALAREKFAALLYGDHPYGRLFPTEEMLKGYTIEQVQNFHRGQFGAGRTRVYVTGIFDAPAVEGAIRNAFEGWPRGMAATVAKVPDPGARRFALLDRPDAPQSTVLLGLRVPSPSHADWVALEVTDALLGGSFGSRITSNIREQKGYTYSPYSIVQSHPGEAYWLETADVTTNVTGESLKEIFLEIDRLRKEPPAATELRGIQNNLAGIFVVQNASRAGVIGRLEFVDVHGLGEDYLTGYVRRVMSVTPEDIRRIANDYLTPDKMTLVVVGDTKSVRDQLGPWSAR